MQSTNFPDDQTEFVRSYNWQNAGQHVRSALDVLKCKTDHKQNLECPAGNKDNYAVHKVLAGHPMTPQAVLSHMAACNTHPQVLERIACNANADGDTIKRLSKHEVHSVRQAVAEGNCVANEVLKDLAVDPHTDVRYALAENHNVPAEILTALAEDENPYVSHRAKLTLNRIKSENAPVTAMEELKSSRDNAARKAV